MGTLAALAAAEAFSSFKGLDGRTWPSLRKREAGGAKDLVKSEAPSAFLEKKKKDMNKREAEGAMDRVGKKARDMNKREAEGAEDRIGKKKRDMNKREAEGAEDRIGRKVFRDKNKREADGADRG